MKKRQTHRHTDTHSQKSWDHAKGVHLLFNMNLDLQSSYYVLQREKGQLISVGGLCRIAVPCRSHPRRKLQIIVFAHNANIHIVGIVRIDQGTALPSPWASPPHHGEGFPTPVDLKHWGSLHGCAHVESFTQDFIETSSTPHTLPNVRKPCSQGTPHPQTPLDAYAHIRINFPLTVTVSDVVF